MLLLITGQAYFRIAVSCLQSWLVQDQQAASVVVPLTPWVYVNNDVCLPPVCIDMSSACLCLRISAV